VLEYCAESELHPRSGLGMLKGRWKGCHLEDSERDAGMITAALSGRAAFDAATWG
jgi:hypothetical protein